MSVCGSMTLGNCISVLRGYPANTFDSIVTDPPYGLSFMGKAWDYDVPKAEVWAECLRVLKPGGHLLAFFGSRTYHRGVCQIEDGGFEIRDSLQWIYGTGFPKSLNVGEGRGTALKPAHEPIVLARKPLTGTVAANVQAHGTGALNIDGCRIGTEEARPTVTGTRSRGGILNVLPGSHRITEPHSEGRWPANVILDEEAARLLDEQSGESKSNNRVRHNGAFKSVAKGAETARDSGGFNDSGSASRFFYVAKASRKERDEGCEALPAKSGGEATDREDGSIGTENPRAGAGRTGGARNFHPTVKPVALMRWLCRLVTPPGGVVLDPFAGSGSTGVAAFAEGFQFLGIEVEADYVAIANARLAAQMPLFGGT